MKNTGLIEILLFLVLIAVCCGGGNKQTDSQHGQARLNSYPFVSHGTYLSFTTDSGNGTVAIVYADNGTLTQQYFFTCYATSTCGSGKKDSVTFPAGPITPGDRIAITRVDDTTYTIEKEE